MKSNARVVQNLQSSQFTVKEQKHETATPTTQLTAIYSYIELFVHKNIYNTMRLFLLASTYLPCVLAQNLKPEYFVEDQDDTHVLPLTAAKSTATTTTSSSSNNNMNYIFLQRFPLQDTLGN